VREANGKLKLHKRICEDARGFTIGAFNTNMSYSNGINGINVSKNGNPVKIKKQMSIGNVDGKEIVIQHPVSDIGKISEILNSISN